MHLSNPYLVQRGRLARNTDGSENITAACGLDYMGRAEFEFGTLPGSLKALAVQSSSGLLSVCDIPGVNDRLGRPMVAIGAFESFEGGVAAYAEKLAALVSGEARSMCWTGIENWVEAEEADIRHPPRSAKTKKMKAEWVEDTRSRRTNFWWDLNNNVMMSFEEGFVTDRLPGHLANSWAKMGLPSHAKTDATADVSAPRP